MNKTTAIITFSIAMLSAGVAGAAGDEQTRDRIQHELTASIAASGVQAMQNIRQALEAQLPQDVGHALAAEMARGLSLKPQVEQLRLAYDARPAADRI